MTLVRLTLATLDFQNAQAPREVLLASEGEEWEVAETARAWATVRGYESLVRGIDHALLQSALLLRPRVGWRSATRSPPASG